MFLKQSIDLIPINTIHSKILQEFDRNANIDDYPSST